MGLTPLLLSVIMTLVQKRTNFICFAPTAEKVS
jgi:hypothetical protein